MNENDLDILLAHLATDRNRAHERLEQYRQSLITFFETKPGVYHPVELADEVISRVANKVNQNATITLDDERYFYGVAKHVLQEYQREIIKFEPLDYLHYETHSFIDPVEEKYRLEEQQQREFLLECCLHCIGKLNDADRSLILDYYRGSTGKKVPKEEKAKQVRNQLGQTLGLSPRALRVRAFRIKIRLEECIRACAKEVTRK